MRYLIGELTDTTVVELTGDTLGAIKEACSIARSLQPAMIVVEDVDLIAEQRDHYGGSTPLLLRGPDDSVGVEAGGLLPAVMLLDIVLEEVVGEAD